MVIPKYGLIGGAEGFAAELTERIAENHRYDIHVFANRWQSYSSRILFHKIPVISTPKFLTTFSFAYFANRLISKTHFDLVHTHERIFQADLFTMHGIPHRLWVAEVRKRNMGLFDRVTKWVEKSLVQNQRCKRFSTVSHLAKETFLREYPQIDSNQVQIIHPGVDFQRFQILNRDECREEIRRHLRLTPREFLILFVSMNFEIKGLTELMAGLAKLKSKHHVNRFKLLVIGKGNVKKFGKLARQLEITDHILFLGVVPREELIRFYIASDVFSMLSKFDTFGISVLEAMAASLPVIISNNVGARDIVRQGENGFIIANPSFAEEIADRIASLTDEGVRRKLGKESRITAGNHGWEAVAQRVQALYEEILNSFDQS